MDHALFFQLMDLLGLRIRYWIIIVVVILILLAVAFYARGRSTV